jgi:hypothetical protein
MVPGLAPARNNFDFKGESLGWRGEGPLIEVDLSAPTGPVPPKMARNRHARSGPVFALGVAIGPIVQQRRAHGTYDRRKCMARSCQRQPA